MKRDVLLGANEIQLRFVAAPQPLSPNKQYHISANHSNLSVQTEILFDLLIKKALQKSTYGLVQRHRHLE